MKTTLSFLIALALAPAAFPDDYTVFRVCQDQHVIRTSDGAEAGHLEYVVIDPGSRQVVSTVVTGGVIGEKYVAVPYESMHFGADREIVLNEITRERLVSAPVIERSRFTSTNVFQRAWLEPTSQHFGVRFDASFREGERGTARTNDSTNPRENERGNARTNEPGANRDNRGTAEAERNGGRPGQATTDPAQGDRNRSETQRNGGRATTEPGQGRNANGQNERNRPEAIGEKTPEHPDAKNRPGREPATPEPKSSADREKNAAEKNATEKNAAEKNQEKASRPGEDVDRDPGKAAEKAQRETGKVGEKAESATDNGRAKAEREALQNAEKSGQAKEKAQEKGERPAGKAEEKSERPQKKSDSEKRTPEEAQR